MSNRLLLVRHFVICPACSTQKYITDHANVQLNLCRSDRTFHNPPSISNIWPPPLKFPFLMPQSQTPPNLTHSTTLASVYLYDPSLFKNAIQISRSSTLVSRPKLVLPHQPRSPRSPGSRKQHRAPSSRKSGGKAWKSTFKL